MFDFTQTQLLQAIMHRIGNKSRAEGYTLSPNLIKTDSDIIRSLLMKYFLSPFKADSLHNFKEESKLAEIASGIFDNPLYLHTGSVEIAQLLYDKSEHPKIKAGELYVAYFKDCVLEDEQADVIGIFKSENRETYLRPDQDESGLKLSYDNGININGLEKGCLIFNIDKQQGYVVAVLDATSKGSDAVFWKDDFLKVDPRKDYHYFTRSYLNLCNEFIKEAHGPGEKTEVTEMQQDTLAFFSEEENFNLRQFEEEVLVYPEKIKQFAEYKARLQEENEMPALPEDFKISPPALKTAKRQFKNLFKLDNNFQINVLNPNGIMVRGYDEQTGQKYYQLYFDAEK